MCYSFLLLTQAHRRSQVRVGPGGGPGGGQDQNSSDVSHVTLTFCSFTELFIFHVQVKDIHKLNVCILFTYNVVSN